MPALLQAKLLRVIEERLVHRLGSRKDIPVDVRILAATNKEPHGAVRDGTLREDLLYRLNVITIHLPALAERMEDLPLLAQHLVSSLAAKHNRPARFISAAALDALRFHSWPGNVRELRNVIERAVIVATGDMIRVENLSEELRGQETVVANRSQGALVTLAELEARHIAAVVAHAHGQIGTAAQILGIHRNTLTRKMKEYGL